MPDDKIIANLSNEIAKTVNNTDVDQVDEIYNQFTDVLNKALGNFNSSLFDNDGFLQKLEKLNLGDKQNQDILKNVLNSVRVDYADVQSLNRSEILIKRDLENLCFQMPDLKKAISITTDSIIESNTANGEISRTYVFENNENKINDNKVLEIEQNFDVFNAIKNYIIPRTLVTGETYVLVTPFSKLFAEIKELNKRQYQERRNTKIYESTHHSLYNEKNLKMMMESVSEQTKVDSNDSIKIQNGNKKLTDSNLNSISKESMKLLLENITVTNTSSWCLEEFGYEGLKEFLKSEAKRQHPEKPEVFAESQLFDGLIDNRDVGAEVVDPDLKEFGDLKGCYIKYLNGLQIVPIRLDRKIIGYYYITTSMDLAINPAQPIGVVDLSFQHYTKDKNLLERLTQLIIQSFDKQMLEKNIQLKNEIAEIVMSHKFANGRLSFVYIPENEVARFVINEDEQGKGHSIIEPALFPGRLYTMLLLYNMLYILNNAPVRVHYLKSSGLNKDYASQIQKAMRKFQARRITIDDIYSYSGVLNKVGGMGEMILPTGRGDYKAIETDTIPGAEQPINIELLDRLRKEAINGTPVPFTMLTDAIESVDFAISVKMANSCFASAISSLKMNFNKGITKFYQMLFKYATDMEDSIISSFKFSFHSAKHQELAVTNEMIQNFNGIAELIGSLYYQDSELKNENGMATEKQIILKRKLAEYYLPQFNFDALKKLIDEVNDESTQLNLAKTTTNTEITDSDFAELGL